MKNELEKHKFLLLCYDHYNPLGVVRSLGEAGIRPIVVLIANSNRPSLIVKSKYPSEIHIVHSPEEGLGYILDNYGNEEFKPFLYSCSDDVCEMLDKNYEVLINKFYFFHGKEQGIVSKYLDKNNINQLALKCGCCVLKNEVLIKGEKPRTLHYPVLTKALTSTLYAWKDEMHICNDESELLDSYKKIRSDKILVQEFIKKKNELCLDGFSFNGGRNVYIPYYSSYLRFSDLSYGGYMELKPFEEGKIYKQICSILQEVGYTGIFEVEFLIDDNDDKWFLEVNFRNSTWSYAYTYGGFNMPYFWALGSLNGDIDINVKKKDRFTAMAEYEDYVMAVKNGGLSLNEWVNDFYNADVHYFYNEQDPAPFSIRKFILKKRIKRLIGKK